MVLSRLEKLFVAAAAVAMVLTVGFGVGLYHALTTQPTTQAAALPQGASAGQTPDTGSVDAGGSAGSQGTSGTAGHAGTSSTTGAGGTRGQAPVAPNVCPFGGGQMVVGSIVSLTGFFQFPEAANAAKAYFQDANAHGGVHGCRVTDQVLDDATDPSTARNDAKQLVADDHVFAVVSMVAPFGQDTIDPYFASPGGDNANQPVPVVGLDPYEENAYKYANEFSVDVPIVDAGALMAQYADTTMKGKFTRPGIFGYNVSQLSAAESGAVGQFHNDGYNNVVIQTVDPSASNYDSIIQGFQHPSDGGPPVDLLMWFCDIGCGERFVGAAQRANYFPHWVNYEIGYDPGYAQGYGGQGGEENGAVVISPFLPFESNSAATSTLYQTVEHYFPGTSKDSVMQQAWLGAELFATEVNRLAMTANLQSDQAALIQAIGAQSALDLGITPPMNMHMGTDPRYSGRVPHRCAQFVSISNGALQWSDHSWHCPQS